MKKVVLLIICFLFCFSGFAQNKVFSYESKTFSLEPSENIIVHDTLIFFCVNHDKKEASAHGLLFNEYFSGREVVAFNVSQNVRNISQILEYDQVSDEAIWKFLQTAKVSSITGAESDSLKVLENNLSLFFYDERNMCWKSSEKEQEYIKILFTSMKFQIKLMLEKNKTAKQKVIGIVPPEFMIKEYLEACVNKGYVIKIYILDNAS